MVGTIFTPVGEWSKLHDRLYRRMELYDMKWEGIDLGRFRAAGANFGGPLALVRDDAKIQAVQRASTKLNVSIYSTAGKLLHQIAWDKGKIAGLGWTETEQLVVVLDDGNVRLYSLHGDMKQFSLGKEAKEQGVLDCRVWGGGLVALTGRFRLIAVTSFDEPHPRLLADMNLNEPPHSWVVIEPQFTNSRNVEVLVATAETVLVVDGNEAQDQRFDKGPVTSMSVSPNGRLLALFTADGVLQVISTDFQKNFSVFPTKTRSALNQLVWCGVDSVVLHWDKLLLMVGPNGDFIDYTYDTALHLVPEVDGVRILSNTKCEFLQRVPSMTVRNAIVAFSAIPGQPDDDGRAVWAHCFQSSDVTADIFTPGSEAPASILYSAYESFERKQPAADDYMRSIKRSLTDAVDACIEAAGHEVAPATQRTLLKASAFGKCFAENYPADKFVEMCRTIRVLNAVRHHETGIALTETQYRRLTPKVLIDRLVNRNQHLLAMRVAEYLKMKVDRILVHWASEKVKRADGDDDSICRMIVEKLADLPSVSYADIAQTAHRVGRVQLATKLLDYEPRAADQVPLLMSMQENEIALVKAIESGDSDLVYQVLLELKRKLVGRDFIRMVSTKPLASSLLQVYCRQQDRNFLKDFYYQDDRAEETAYVTLLESYETKDTSERVRTLQRGLRLLQEAKDQAANAKATEEQIRLLQMQETEDKETKGKDKVADLSVSETIYKLILTGRGDRANKFKSEFKVPDKRFWWIKLKATVEAKDWEELDRFAKSKKSPIGYGPFVAECMARGFPKEAIKYVVRCEPPERPALFMTVGAFQEAAEAAFQIKDMDALNDVRARCNNPKIVAVVDGFLAQLSSKR